MRPTWKASSIISCIYLQRRGSSSRWPCCLLTAQEAVLLGVAPKAGQSPPPCSLQGTVDQCCGHSNEPKHDQGAPKFCKFLHGSSGAIMGSEHSPRAQSEGVRPTNSHELPATCSQAKHSPRALEPSHLGHQGGAAPALHAGNGVCE